MNIKNKIKAILFDMDGTLTDTEKYYKELWPKAMKEYGYEMSYEQYLDVRELGSPYIDKYLKENFGDISFKEVGYRVLELFEKEIKNDIIPLRKGVLEALKFIKSKNLKIAIVTSSYEDRAKRILKDTSILLYIDEVLGAGTVKNGKPSPEIFLAACKKLNLKPEETIVVEDAPNGVMGAYNAGCNVIMVPEANVKRDEEVYDKTIKVLESLDLFENFYMNEC